MAHAAFEGRVLERESTPGDFTRLQVLCPEAGMRMVMLRAGGRGRIAVPDLFDLAAFEVDLKESGTAFARDVRILARTGELARNYDALEAACRLAKVFLLNRGSPEGATLHAALFERALAGFAGGVRPDCCYLKALFLLLTDEGYPVREDWVASLSPESAAELDRILSLPLSAQENTPERTRVLTRQLETWSENSLDLRFPQRPA